MSLKKVVVVGATGMVGNLCVKRAAARDDVGQVLALARRPSGVVDPKVQDVLHADFSDLGPLAPTLEGVDAALFCLGAYTGTIPDDEFRKVTVDYAVDFAKALFAASPSATFCLLSGQGADPTGKSRMAFARYKGIAETEIRAVGFPRSFFMRPGYIYPVEPRSEPNFAYRLSRAIYPGLRRVFPNASIRSDELARVMVDVGLEGAESSDGVLENHRLRLLAGAA